jgi:hypothetical protein
MGIRPLQSSQAEAETSVIARTQSGTVLKTAGWHPRGNYTQTKTHPKQTIRCPRTIKPLRHTDTRPPSGTYPPKTQGFYPPTTKTTRTKPLTPMNRSYGGHNRRSECLSWCGVRVFVRIFFSFGLCISVGWSSRLGCIVMWSSTASLSASLQLLVVCGCHASWHVSHAES